MQDNKYPNDIVRDWSDLNNLIIDFLKPHITGHYLDVGANSGWLLSEVVGGVGIELSASLVEKAREKGLDVRLSDVNDRFPFCDGEFDTAVLSCVLEQTDKPMSVLKEALRVASDKVIGISPIPDASVWGKVGGTKWVKSVIFPGVLKVLYKANIVNLCDTHYYFEIRKDKNK